MITISSRRLAVSLAITSTILVAGATNHVRADVYPTPREVLILYSFRHLMPINLAWDRGIRSAIESQPSQVVIIHTEFLDLGRLANQEYQQEYFRLLRLKYGKSKIDAVIPICDPAADFVAKNHNDLFADTPVVYCSISEGLRKRLPPSRTITGVTFRFDFDRTLQVIRDVLPGTRQVVVVVGATDIEKKLQEAARNAFSHEHNIDFLYLSGLPANDLLGRLSRLPDDCVVLFVSHDRDRDGRESISSRDIVERVSQAANVPVFGLYDAMLGHGIVGGCLTPVEDQGKRAGEIAMRSLAGGKARRHPFYGNRNEPLYVRFKTAKTMGNSRANAAGRIADCVSRAEPLEGVLCLYCHRCRGNSVAIPVDRRTAFKSEKAIGRETRWRTGCGSRPCLPICRLILSILRRRPYIVKSRVRSPESLRRWIWTAERSSRFPTMGLNCERRFHGCGPAWFMRPPPFS